MVVLPAEPMLLEISSATVSATLDTLWTLLEHARLSLATILAEPALEVPALNVSHANPTLTS